jgi:hypothetical protein
MCHDFPSVILLVLLYQVKKVPGTHTQDLPLLRQGELNLGWSALFAVHPSEHVRNDGAVELRRTGNQVRDSELSAERF